MPKRIVLTRHAQARMIAYAVTSDAVTETLEAPDWIEADPQPGVERRFRRRAELGGRVLRVACREERDYILVLSAFPDRDARPPDGP